MVRSLLTILTLVFVASVATAYEGRIDLPVADGPFNFSNSAYWFPSPKQTIRLSNDFYHVSHQAIQGQFSDEGLGRTFKIISIGVFDYLSGYVPLGSSWAHEEGHRAVLGRRGYHSYDDVNNFPFFASSISVSHVRDEDLTALKADHPAEQVRLSSAGMEFQTVQNLELEKDRFFHENKDESWFLMWMNNFGVWGYLSLCASPEADTFTDKANRDDGADIAKRDFTGLDCNGWVYDLFRPDEPYANRGTHPSGVGIDRYRIYSTLSQQEKDYLHQQANLALLNFASPFLLYGFHEFDAGSFKWNANLKYYMTSFGNNVDLNFFYKSEGLKFLATLHNYFNAVRYSPGLEVGVVRHSVEVGGKTFFISPTVAIWMQPKNQLYRDAKWTAGGMLAANIAHPVSSTVEPYVEVEAKTAGWVAANAYLDRNLSLLAGLNLVF